MIEILLKKCANIEAESSYKYTPLILGKSLTTQLDFRLLNYCFVASKKGYLEVVKILLENGANIEKHDDRGCTPLMWGKNKK